MKLLRNWNSKVELKVAMKYSIPCMRKGKRCHSNAYMSKLKWEQKWKGSNSRAFNWRDRIRRWQVISKEKHIRKLAYQSSLVEHLVIGDDGWWLIEGLVWDLVQFFTLPLLESLCLILGICSTLALIFTDIADRLGVFWKWFWQFLCISDCNNLARLEHFKELEKRKN